MSDSDTKIKEMVVLVTQRIDHIQDYGETRDALDQRLVEWLRSTGLIPVPVPNSLITGDLIEQGMDEDYRHLTQWVQRLDPGALVLSGGNNIGQYPRRDLTEGYLLAWAEKHVIPVIGICRGMQFMTNQAGGELVEVTGHVAKRHPIKKVIDEEILPDVVNSYHDWGIRECPDRYQVLARSEDGVLEAIRHKSVPWEGWMWHPEREHEFNDVDTERLINLISKGSNL